MGKGSWLYLKRGIDHRIEMVVRQLDGEELGVGRKVGNSLEAAPLERRAWTFQQMEMADFNGTGAMGW